MARIKWNTMVNPNDTNMNNVQKTPPECLKNHSRNSGRMSQPFFNSSMSDQLKNLNSMPPASSIDVSHAQPGQSSREGTFDYSCLPGVAGNASDFPIDGLQGRSPVGWSQPNSVNGRTAPGIQSNLTDIPSVWKRKFTSQK